MRPIPKASPISIKDEPMRIKCTVMGLIATLIIAAAAFAGDGHECVTHCCKLVPEVKQIKKTVYEVHEVPYCLKKLPPLWSLLHHRGCDCEMCAQCQCPRYKKVLVMKEVVCKEICTSKCVVEEHVERVPCQVCK
jgi:hypothetical protein